ncbi:unnamed protein product [Paramecium sonneborni]|uniref:Uncharacterized protein n=1 Tax=Paramecium sonneborni TaxID=65129 RepID=A0A8S1Q3W6_9CILI|nr:unnamed protein product [Paramecium sonneborni]
MDQKCNYENHNKIILYCCTNFQCKYQRTVCDICLKEFHNDHIDDLQNNEKLIEFRQKKKIILAQIKTFRQEFQQFFDFFNDFITSVTISEDEKLENCTLTQLNFLTKKLVVLDQLQKSGLIENTLKPLNINIKTTQQNIKNLKKEFKKVENKQIPQNIHPQNQPNFSIQPGNKIKQNCIRFSQQYKASNIELINSNTIAINQNRTFSLVLCEPGVTSLEQQREFAFKILKKDWIALGICHKSLLSNQKYEVNLWEDHNHGCYLIDEQGKVYSRLNARQNNRTKNFSLSENDVIIIKVNKIKKEVEWINQSKKEQLWIANIDVSKDIYPVICLYESRIQIIDEF